MKRSAEELLEISQRVADRARGEFARRLPRDVIHWFEQHEGSYMAFGRACVAMTLQIIEEEGGL